MDSNTILETYTTPFRLVMAALGLVIICLMLAVLVFVDKKIFDGIKNLKEHDPDASLCGVLAKSAIGKTKRTAVLHMGGMIFGLAVLLLFSFRVPWDMAINACLLLGAGGSLIAFVGTYTFDAFWGVLEMKLLLRSLR